MSGKKLQQFVKICKYGSHGPLFEEKIAPGIKCTTRSAINVLKQTAFFNRIVSLSANQIGLDERIFVALKQPFLIPGKWDRYEDLKGPQQYEAIVNPDEVGSSEEQLYFFEECPSFQGMMFKVKGSLHMQISYICEHDLQQKKEQQLSGFQCRVWDHEYRHLQGLLPIYEQICNNEFFLRPEYKGDPQSIKYFNSLKKIEKAFTKEQMKKRKQK